MTRYRHPIDDVFNVDDFDKHEDEFMEIDNRIDELPCREERDLDMIIDYALRQYQAINNVINDVEPVKRLKYYEIAKEFLVQAKDAIHKRDVLCAKKQQKKTTPLSEKTEQPKESEGVSRDDLAERIKQEKIRRVK